MKPTNVRISRLQLRIRQGAAPAAADVARAVAEQCSARHGASLPRPVVAALGERLAASLAAARKK